MSKPTSSDNDTAATLGERLRKECRYHDKLNVLCGPDAPHPYCLPCEAAAEIEKLHRDLRHAERTLGIYPDLKGSCSTGRHRCRGHHG